MKLLQIIFFLIYIGFNICKTLESQFKFAKKYTTNDIINLILLNKSQFYKLIDPDDYIKEEDERSLEEKMKDTYNNHKIVPIIIISNNIDLQPNGKNITITNFTQILIDEIYSRKIYTTDTPIIIAVISIEGKIMTMNALGKASFIISQQDCFNILSIINTYYSYDEYSKGTLELGKFINFYVDNTEFFSRNKRFFLSLAILLFLFFFCYFLSYISQKIRDWRSERLTMNDEEKLLKIREFLKKTKANRKILDNNCIICFEPFDNCVSLNNSSIKDNNGNLIVEEENGENKNENQNENKNENKNEININKENNEDIQNEMNNIDKQSNSSGNKITTLPCGHRFHFKCITEWMLRQKNICPMCREKINVDIPDENDEEDLLNEILNIQVEFHPIFAIITFEIIDQELTWSLMSLPAVGGGFLSGFWGFALL